MVDVDGSCQFSADSQPKSVCRPPSAQSTSIKWTGWTIDVIIIIINIIICNNYEAVSSVSTVSLYVINSLQVSMYSTIVRL